MKVAKRIFVALLTITSAALLATSSSAADGTEEIKAANGRFYDALSAIFVGNSEPMNKIWSHNEDIVFMGPDGGFQTGWNQVKAQWNEQAALKLGGKVVPEQIHITAGKEIATVSLVEKGENKDAQGKTLPVSIRATNVFRLENGEWKMVGHHTDTLPFLEKK